MHTGTIDELIWLKWRSPSLAVWVPNPHRCLLAFNRFNGDLPTKSTQICWRRADTNCLKHDKMGKREKVRQRTFDLSKRVGNANFSKKQYFFWRAPNDEIVVSLCFAEGKTQKSRNVLQLRTFWMIHTLEDIVNTMACTKNEIAKSTHRHVPFPTRRVLYDNRYDIDQSWTIRNR